MNTESQQPVDVFSMSADEFAKFEGSLDSNTVESSEEDSTILDSEEQSTDVESDDQNTDESTDEFIDVEGADDEIEDEETNTDESDESTEEESEEEEESTDTIDFESEYKRLIGSPIKANGKDLVIDSMDDAIKLIQMGANYYKKVEQLKPAQKIIAMLETKGLLDESKLSFAIDLMNKNPQAIRSLISDMDLNEIVDDSTGEYKPSNYSVSDQQIALDTALKDIQDSPSYNRTVEVLGKVWDNKSREIVRSNPQAISLINEHITNGIFDTVTAEVEKRKMLGTIPQGLSDIEAYKFVGDSLYANQSSKAAPSQAQAGQQTNQTKANVKPPIRKPNKDTVVQQKKAASTPRGKPSVSREIENVFAMSSEEFYAKYGKHL